MVSSPEGQFQEALEKTRWISDLYKTYLKPPILNRTIYSLGCGDGLELLHLREFCGPQARMVAIEKSPYYTTIPIAVYTNTKFFQADIRNVQRYVVTQPPGLIISRAPRIIEGVNEAGDIITINEWWFDTLGQWARALPEHGQMLITTLHPVEHRLLAEALKQQGLSFISSKFSGYNRKLEIKYGPLVAAPDKQVLYYCAPEVPLQVGNN